MTFAWRSAARPGDVYTLDALAAGANDYVTKPVDSAGLTIALARIKSELIPKIRALCGRNKTGTIERSGPPKLMAAATRLPSPIEIVAIGVSTGGPNALSDLLPALPKNLPVPIVIVQHMPPIFTKLLADRLSAQSEIDVKEGAAGMTLRPGQAVLAAGGSHMSLKRYAGGVCVETDINPPVNSCRPAVDVLFRSVALNYGPKVLAVVLTGMGCDGLRGCEYIREAGGQVIVQDEASSVVWGMPGYVARAGLAQKVLPLGQIAAEIGRLVNQKFAGARQAAVSA